MHDKELDELFSGKLKRLELKPDDRVWKSIVLELDGAKPKCNFWQMILWTVLIMMILAGGILILLKKSEVKSRQQQTNLPVIVDKQDVSTLIKKIEIIYQHRKKDK